MFKNMKIGTRLLIGFVFVLVLVIGSMLVTSVGTSKIAQNLETFYNESYNISNLTFEMKLALEKAENSLFKCTMYSEKTIVNENIAKVEEELKILDELYKDIVQKYPNNEVLKEYNEVMAQTPSIFESIFSDLRNNMKSRAIKSINEKLTPLTEQANNLLDKSHENSNSKAVNFVKSASRFAKSQSIIIIILVIINIVFIIGICLVLTKSIVKPIAEIKSAISSLAVGKLNSNITYDGKNELGELADDMRKTLQELSGYITNISYVLGEISKNDLDITVDMDYIGDFSPIKHSMEEIIYSLNNTVELIGESAEQVTNGAEQVSGGAILLSQGATEQASAIQQLSASIAEVSDQVVKNADNAKNASDISAVASKEVENGNKLMRQMMDAMQEIGRASGEIEKIIKTIDDIAFQTNILALNAAVEAARAGTAGKGFAVVADEVRNLAGKSAESAKNTTALIENAIKAVENGTKIAEQTARSLQMIVEGAKQSTALIDKIAEASKEQSSSIEQISLGIEQISAVVQTNSATAQESAASSEELSGQAQILKELVSRFTLKYGEATEKNEIIFDEIEEQDEYEGNIM